MSLLTGPGMSPPKYGKGVIGTVTNGDKLLCNRPAHLHFGFLAPKVAFKVFFLHIGFYPSGEGRQTVTQAKCHVCSATPVADGWLFISIL